MTRLNHPQLLQSVRQLLNDEGSDGFAEGLRLLVNEAMQAERSHVLKAQPFEHISARLRTSNALERVNQELQRRTRVVSIFPNEASLLRLVSALLAETSDDSESSKSYLNMLPSILPSA